MATASALTMRDPEHVDHGEQRLHDHFEHHGNREQHDGAADALLGEVAMGVAEDGVADGRQMEMCAPRSSEMTGDSSGRWDIERNPPDARSKRENGCRDADRGQRLDRRSRRSELEGEQLSNMGIARPSAIIARTRASERSKITAYAIDSGHCGPALLRRAHRRSRDHSEGEELREKSVLAFRVRRVDRNSRQSRNVGDPTRVIAHERTGL